VHQLEGRTLLSAYPVLTVNTTVDEKDGGTLVSPAGPDMKLSLREAITVANLDSGANTINFNIPTTDPNYNAQWWTIQVDLYDVTAVSASLPTLTDSGTTIDGFSQTANQGDTNPGVVGTGGTVGVDQEPLPQYQKPEIAIDRNGDEGASAIVDFNPRGLTIGGNASNILIQGMAIYDVGRPLGDADDFDIAIFGEGGSGTNRVVQAMLVGVLPDGSDPGLERDRGFGVRQDTGGQLTVTKNYVGLNGRGGLDSVANTAVVTFTYNEVFENGWASMDHDGIDLNGINSIARYNLSRDNTNMLAFPTGSSGAGIELGSQTAGTGNNLIENNTLSGNLSAGISDRKGSSLNTIQENVIFGNQVGISVNTEGRVPTNRNVISQNSTYLNFGLGIDLEDQDTTLVGPWQGFASPGGRNPAALPPGSPGVVLDGVTPNDTGDGDTGSNDLQNWPVLTTAVASGNSTSVSGTLNSLPGSTFRIEFYWTPDTDLFAPDDREGHYFLGSKTVTTDALGNASFSANFNATIAPDSLIFATATCTATSAPGGAVNDTSEFSNGVARTPVSEVGKVTGGGSIEPAVVVSSSPATPSTDHRANFGFNAKYHDGDPVPVGHTNFNWNPGNIHFDSTSYDPLSLVITSPAPDVQKAQWTGKGTVNHQPGYTFKCQVTDRGEAGTDDSFRIQIKNSAGVIVYDNGADPDVETTLATGNIQVHGSSGSSQSAATPDGGAVAPSTSGVLFSTTPAAPSSSAVESNLATAVLHDDGNTLGL
jgi:hypothetical protein